MEESREDPGSSTESRVEPASHGDAPGGDDREAAYLRRLAAHSHASTRYRVEAEFARGGMGTIHRVWDHDLHRSLAMKRVATRGRVGTDGGVADPRVVTRLLDEAQITGQLDHPGIVPVHELGLDERGRAYFTMRLVRGESLRSIFQKVHAGDEGWTLARALGVILRVCEAVAYAHSKGVIHRDLKPANVMVGRFGETYVMDWGLAKVLGRESSEELRRAAALQSSLLSAVRTERSEAEASDPDSPIVTMEGDVVGTPCFMAPEQAAGHVERLDARSDVYSVGAMLYNLLTGQRPYLPPESRASARTILCAVLAGPPAPIERVRPHLPAELVALCEKAMAREPEQRYDSMLAMAEDLRAFLEGRVVRAHATGAVAELRKWVARNRGLAAALGAALVTVVGGLGAVSYVQAEGRRTADELKVRADSNAARAEDALTNARTFSDSFLLERLLRGADELWPPYPERAAELEGWLWQAEDLLGRVDGHRAELERLRARALPYSTAARAADRAPRPELEQRIADEQGALAALEAVLARWEVGDRQDLLAQHERTRARLEELVAERDARRTWEFESHDDTWRHAALAAFLEAVPELPEVTRGMRSRLDFARSVEEQSVGGPEARRRWEELRADVAADERFGGRVPEPVLGLLPLRRDPTTGLWELWHLASGEQPRLDRASGFWIVEPATGLVLVLLPGGTFQIGCEPPSAGRAVGEPYVDPHATAEEGDLVTVRLDPFLISKYEVTQAQWTRVMGSNPSQVTRARTLYSEPDTPAEAYLLRPVENVTWNAAVVFARRLALAIPTEAQWEAACRAGTTTPFPTGEAPESIYGSSNFADHACWLANGALEGWEFDTAHDDGFGTTAPVGSFAPSANGLFDVLGNVDEWTRDPYSSWERTRPRAGDGERALPDVFDGYVFRGGAWSDPPRYHRSAGRRHQVPTIALPFLGLRPSLDLFPAGD